MSTGAERMTPCADPGLGSFGVSIPVAGVLAALVVLCGDLALMPSLPWVAGFLFLCMEAELRVGRVPPALIFVALLSVLGHWAFVGDELDLLHGLAGAMAGFALVLLAAGIRWERTPETLVLMVLGAFWGLLAVFGVSGYAIVARGALAIPLWKLGKMRSLALTPFIALGVIFYQLWGAPWS